MSAVEWKSLSRKHLFDRIRAILSYQFNQKFAQVFLAPFQDMKIKFSRRTGKIKYLFLKSELQGVYLPRLGTFAISLYAARRIYKKLSPPRFRVQVLTDISKFIKDGKSVFAKHVVNIDKKLRIGKQCFVVDQQDNLLAIGKLQIPPRYIGHLKNGVAVDVKKGIDKI